MTRPLAAQGSSFSVSPCTAALLDGVVRAGAHGEGLLYSGSVPGVLVLSTYSGIHQGASVLLVTLLCCGGSGAACKSLEGVGGGNCGAASSPYPVPQPHSVLVGGGARALLYL